MKIKLDPSLHPSRMTMEELQQHGREEQLEYWGFKNEEEYNEYQDKEKAGLINKNKELNMKCLFFLLIISLGGLLIL